MPENEGEDDDDFGDFKFVSSTLNRNNNNDDGDDYWGDFVESPLHFHSNNSFQHSPKSVEDRCFSDPFWFSQVSVSDSFVKISEFKENPFHFQANNGFHNHKNPPNSAGSYHFSEPTQFFLAPVSVSAAKIPESVEGPVDIQANNGFLHGNSANYWTPSAGNHRLFYQATFSQSSSSDSTVKISESVEKPLQFQANNGLLPQTLPDSRPQSDRNQHFYDQATVLWSTNSDSVDLSESREEKLHSQGNNGLLFENPPNSRAPSTRNHHFSGFATFFQSPTSDSGLKISESKESPLRFQASNGFINQNPQISYSHSAETHLFSDQTTLFQSLTTDLEVKVPESTEIPSHFQASNGFLHQNPRNSCPSSTGNHQFSDSPHKFQAPTSDLPESKPTYLDSSRNSTSQGATKSWERPQGAIPLSIFGDSEMETSDARNSDDLFDTRNGFSFKPAEPEKTDVNGSDFALNDLIASLYSQADQIGTANSFLKSTEEGPKSVQLSSNSDLISPSVGKDDDFDENCWEFKDASMYSQAEQIGTANSTQKVSEEGPKSVHLSSNSDLVSSSVDNDDDFDEKCWEFKDASSFGQAEQIYTANSLQRSTEELSDSVQLSLNSDLISSSIDSQGKNYWEFKDAFSETNPDSGSRIVGAPQNSSTKEKVKDFMVLYSILKEESRSFVLRHLDELEKAQTTAVICGDEAKSMALGKEIQEASEKLREESGSFKQGYLGEHPPRDLGIGELLEALNEPKFQLIDSEYQLSKRICSAKEELNSALGLFEHAVLVLRIMTLASTENQSSYVHAWSKMISVSARELQHGSMIWNQSLHKNVFMAILSEPHGIEYFIALGEIYRVVEVLRASAELYKPWILSNSEESINIFTGLKDCAALWSESRLKEAFESISDSASLQYEGKIRELMESITSIRDIDPLALQNHVFAQARPICRLSLLSLGNWKGMKAVIWNGEHYFLTLANLWANLVSCDHPKLPLIHVG